MSTIKLHDKYFKPYISKDKIAVLTQSMATQIAEDCKDEIPVFIGILNGCFMFVSDFIRQYPTDCEVSFVKLASYEGTKSTGTVN